MFPSRRLDRDLTVDRTKVWEIEDLSLYIPAPIRIGTTAVFEILNYNAWYDYQVTFSHGTFIRIGPEITYYAPEDHFGPVSLTITVVVPDVDSFVIFEDGTVYTQDGTINKAGVVNGKYSFLFRETDYEEDLNSRPADDIPSPIPSSKKYGSSEIDTFNFGSFGELGSSKLSQQQQREKNGGIADYYLPSEKNKKPDEVKYLYSVEDGKFITVPRNSNVTESDGDIFKGYRKPGDVGGSLTVVQNEAVLSRTFQFQFVIKLWDLTARIPDEIIALCLNTLAVTPSFIGNRLGHTYEWEQIDGDQSNVTWVSEKTDPNMIINLGELKVDRVFRFWISRGTEYEKSYIMVLYGTPLDRSKSAISGRDDGYGFGQNHLNIKVHDVSPLVLTPQILWHKQLRVDVIRNY